MADQNIDVNFPVSLLYGEYTEIKLAFATDRPMREAKPRTLDAVFKEGTAEARIDFWDTASWKKPNPDFNDKPWTRQFLSALNHFGDLIKAAHQIEYVEADYDKIDLDLIRIAFTGLIPVGGDAQANAEQCTLQLVNYLQEYDLLPKLPGDRNVSLPGGEEAPAVTVPAAAAPAEAKAEEAKAEETPAETKAEEAPKKSTWL